MKKLLLFFCYFFALGLNAQSLNFLVYDATTRLPIAYANIVDTTSAAKTMSNQQGKALLLVKNIHKAIIKISHITYITQSFPASALHNLDTVFLQPAAYVLDEAIVTNFDLIKSFNKVLDNYDTYYVDYPTLSGGRYNEMYTINEAPVRLINADIAWWTKSEKYRFGPLTPLSNFSAIELTKDTVIFYPLKIPIQVENASLPAKLQVQTRYLNFGLKYLKILNFLAPIQTNSITYSEDNIKVVFESQSREKNNSKFSFSCKGECYLDRNTQAIKFIKLSGYLDQKPNQVEDKADPQKSYTIKTEEIFVTLQFDHGLDTEKLSLSFMQFGTKFSITHSQTIYNAVIQDEVIFTERKKWEKFSGKSIDFGKSILSNVQHTPATSSENLFPLAE